MSNNSHDVAESGPSHRSVEIGVAICTALLGLIVVAGSLQVGISWGPEGPRAGFFPFYLGLIIILASGVNIVHAVSDGRSGGLFAEWGQLRQVMSVVIPTAVYVALVPNLGIYVSSILLIAVFMKWLGRYGWRAVIPISIGVPVAFYFVFERWFLLPLPKGPIEDLLGL
jgi:hypothetical protein